MAYAVTQTTLSYVSVAVAAVVVAICGRVLTFSFAREHRKFIDRFSDRINHQIATCLLSNERLNSIDTFTKRSNDRVELKRERLI